MKQMEVEVRNEQGIHAGPAALIAGTVKKFESSLTIRSEDTDADASSILEILSLGAVKGTMLTLIADGKDEDSLLAELQQLIEADKFYES